MDSEGDKESGGGQNSPATGQMKTFCVMKVPSLDSNPISSVPVESTSKTSDPQPTLPMRGRPSSVITLKPGEPLSKNIFRKDGILYMKCANSNKIVKLQVTKAIPATVVQGSDRKLTAISVKTLPKDLLVTKKLPTDAAPQVFKPIAKAPLTEAPVIPAKPQPEATTTPKSEKAEVRSIQITNLPTGTVLDFKGPTFGLNSRFPVVKDAVETALEARSRVYNVQISNGQLSDPNGPIKMLGLARRSLTVTRSHITIQSDDGVAEEDASMQSRKGEMTPRKLTRSSSADETPPKKPPTPRRASEPITETHSMEETPKVPVVSLFCDESLENSSEGEKSHKSPVQDHLNGQVDILMMSDSDPAEKEREFRERSFTQQNANCQLMKLSTRREGEDEDALNLIRWEDGVGYLYGSNLHFQFNELGLVDIMDEDEYLRYQQTESHYDRPICEREMISMRSMETATEPVYSCIGCSSFGHAADFMAPDYCSKTCLNLARRRTRVEPERRKGRDPESVFPWSNYLELTKSQKASEELFQHCSRDILEWFEKNPFRSQTKMEAIDPDNCSVFGVVTVLHVRGHRMLLHFDGCPVRYDFWVNFGSPDVFPPRWSEHEGKNLIVPRGKREKFMWKRYLEETKCEAAKLKNFRHLSGTVKSHGFKVGMKLEAENVKGTGKLTVATVADVIGNRVRIHFDGKSDNNDYWCDYDSPRLHPIDFHKTVNEHLITPTKRVAGFSWARFLSQTRSRGVPNNAFLHRPPRSFRKGTKLEAVDRVCPEFIRPATVIDVVGYELRILYDGFEAQYAYWVDDDSTDIFPAGYCEATGHPLEAVPSGRWPTQRCGLKVCAGRGSILNQWESKHDTAAGCPYNMANYNHRSVRTSRLNAKHVVTDYALRFSLVRKCKLGGGVAKAERPAKVTQKRPRKTAPETSRKAMKVAAQEAQPSTSSTPSGGEARGVWSSSSGMRSFVEIEGRRQVNPLLWTTNEVVNFLTNLPNCAQIADKFRQEDINGEAFLALSKDDLTNLLDIKLGPAIKLYNLIVKLRSDINDQFLQF